MCANSQNSQAGEAAEAQRAEARHGEVDDRRLAADGGQVAVVDVAERPGRLAAQAAQQVGRGGAAHLLGAGLTPGTGVGSPCRGSWPRRGRRRPRSRDGRPGSGRARPRPGRRGRARRRCRGQLGAERRGGDAGGPDHGAAVDALRAAPRRRRASRRSTPSASIAGHLASRCARRRRAARAARARARESVGTKAPSTRSEPSSSTHARLRVESMRRNSPRQRVLRDLGHRAGHLDAGRAAADDDEGQPGVARSASSLRALGALEGADHAGADRRRRRPASSGPARCARPLVVAEVAVGGAGGDDQVVVGDALAAVERDAARRRRRSPAPRPAGSSGCRAHLRAAARGGSAR